MLQKWVLLMGTSPLRKPLHEAVWAAAAHFAQVQVQPMPAWPWLPLLRGSRPDPRVPLPRPPQGPTVLHTHPNQHPLC